MTSDVTSQGQHLIGNWLAARRRKERAATEQENAAAELAEQTNALGRWMAPEDAQIGETFCVWHGDSLIAVRYTGADTYSVSVRKRGKSLR